MVQTAPPPPKEAGSFGKVNKDGSLVAGGQRVFARAPVMLTPLESKGGGTRHVEGGGRTAVGSADVACQVCRSDIGNWAVVLWG